MRNVAPVMLGFAISLLAVCAGCDCKGPAPLAMPHDARGAQEEPAVRPAAAVEFVEDLDRGLQQAEEGGKPLLLFFNVRECVYCARMLNETFADREVVRLADQFICVRIDADEARDVCRKFHVEAFPTVQFISPQGVPLSRLLGKVEAEPFASQMEAALRVPQNRTAYRSDSILR